MERCSETAVLIVTLTPAGTATNVARRRIELDCDLAPGHAGLHRNAKHQVEWESGRPLILRHEDEVP
jgi:hypothetical protein